MSYRRSFPSPRNLFRLHATVKGRILPTGEYLGVSSCDPSPRTFSVRVRVEWPYYQRQDWRMPLEYLEDTESNHCKESRVIYWNTKLDMVTLYNCFGTPLILGNYIQPPTDSPRTGPLFSRRSRTLLCFFLFPVAHLSIHHFTVSCSQITLVSPRKMYFLKGRFPVIVQVCGWLCPFYLQLPIFFWTPRLTT